MDLLVAAAAFAVFLCAHIALWHWLGPYRAGFPLLATLWLLVTGAAVSIPAWLGVTAHPLTVLAVLTFLLALYLQLYLGMLRSVSLRILGELSAQGGTLTRETLDASYSPQVMLDGRLAWMVDRGWLDRDDSDYRLTDSGRRVLALRRPFVALMVEGPTG